MNKCVLSVTRYLIPAFVTACWATGSVAQGPPNGLSVNVLNTPLAVTGSVTASGSVNLAPGATVKIDTSLAPVRVKSVNDGIQPIQIEASCLTQTVGCGTGSVYTVPINKRLVVEYVSMHVCGLPGLTAEGSMLTSNVGTSGFVTHAFNVTPPTFAPGSTAIGCNSATPSSTTSIGQLVRIYAETGSTVTMEGLRANGIAGTATFRFSISGYLVDVP